MKTLYFEAEVIVKTARRMALPLLLMFGFASVLSATAQAPEEDYVKANYTKYEYRIPMRDGVRLFTAVYVPKDASQSYPFLMNRTPYSVSPYGVDHYPKRLGPSDEFEKARLVEGPNVAIEHRLVEVTAFADLDVGAHELLVHARGADELHGDRADLVGRRGRPGIRGRGRRILRIHARDTRSHEHANHR